MKINFNVTSYPYPDKCEVLRITHARDFTSYPYKLSGCTLQSVTETVDLGVSLTSNLSWNTQTQTVVNKANMIVGFLKRNVGPGNKEVFSRLYKALVIPILEYAVPLWSPNLLFRRTLTPLKESNVGPRNTLFRSHLGTLRTKKD